MRISKARLTASAATTIAALALGGVGMVHAQTYGGTSGTNSLVPSSYSSGAANGGTTTGAGTFGTTATVTSPAEQTGSAAGTSRASGTTTTSSSSTPGIPNTGAAGDAATNLTVLALSAIVALFAGTYLWRQRSRLD